jgi:hypothetical protein
MSEQGHLKWSAGFLSDIYSGSKFEPYDNPMNYVFADSTYCHCLVSVINLIYFEKKHIHLWWHNRYFHMQQLQSQCGDLARKCNIVHLLTA